MMEGKLPPKPATRRPWLWMFAIIITLSLFIAGFWYNTPFIPMAQLHQADVCIPSESSQSMNSVVFREYDEYQSLSHEFDDHWNGVLTPNGGFIMVREKNDTKHQYGISMYHQLHCLKMIRGAMQDMQSQIEGQSATEHKHTDDNLHLQDRDGAKHHTHPSQDHWLHCLDYLRQTILCSADGTIELPKTRPSGKEIINGMGERTCRDWTLLRDLSLRKEVLAESLPERVI